MHLGGNAIWKQQDNDDKMMAELLRIIPEAFVFEDLGKEGQSERIAFHPNPEFQPKTYEHADFARFGWNSLCRSSGKANSTPFRFAGNTSGVWVWCNRPRGARWLHGNYARSSFAAGLENQRGKNQHRRTICNAQNNQ